MAASAPLRNYTTLTDVTVGPGIGGLIMEGREHFSMDLVILGIVILAATGFVLNTLASRISRLLLRWES